MKTGLKPICENILSIPQCHIENVIEHMGIYAELYSRQLDAIIELLCQARAEENDVFVYGSGYNAELASHANVDWIKFADIRVHEIGIPTLTAYANDYELRKEWSTYFRHRGFNEDSILVALNTGKEDRGLSESLNYISSIGGKSVLITNCKHQLHGLYHAQVFIETEDSELAGDVIQTMLHFVTVRMDQHSNTQSIRNCANSYMDYTSYLVRSLYSERFRGSKLELVGDTIHNALKGGGSVYAFGNGGSAAMVAYFIDKLRGLFEYPVGGMKTIFNLSFYIYAVHESIKLGQYKKEIFSALLRGFGITKDDILLGVSTSGNSPNIIDPFEKFPNAKKVGILGFGDGGRLGNSDLLDFPVIIPDELNMRSYALAEDGQRIVLTAILKHIRTIV